MNGRASWGRLLVIVGMALTAGLSAPVFAQQTVVTPRGPQSGGELVSLRRDMTWGEALEVIQRAGRQVIVYPAGGDKPIGVGIYNRPWTEALDLLLSANHLERAERAGYWEIVTPTGGVTEAAPAAFSLKSRQVQISAVFFVADRSALREIGVDWTTLADGVVTAANPEAAVEGLAGQETGGAGVFRGASQVSSDLFEMAGAHTAKVGGHEIRVQALLRALESQNLGEIIATPQITVVDNKQGVVSVGRDFATTTADFAGNTVTRFHSTATNLVVTPQVITESGIDFIHLTIGTERSALIDPVQQIIDKTNADTEVLLFNGEETAIAGLFQVEQTNLRRGVPWLKDLPPWFFGLRYIFGYDRVQKVDKELVIIIRAELVPTIVERIQTKLNRPPGTALEEKRREFQGFWDRQRQLEQQGLPQEKDESQPAPQP